MNLKRRLLTALLCPGLVSSAQAADLTTAEEIQQLYIAYLGRPADGPGLAYWTEQVDLGNISLEQIRVNLVNEQPEYLENYGQLTTSDLVETVYLNLFNRESDAAGRDYWVGQLDSGAFYPDQLIVAFINGAAEPDQIVVRNKVTIADCYTAEGEYTYRQVIHALGEAHGVNLLTECPLAPAVPFTLNDTGATSCVDETNSANTIDCLDAAFPQDPLIGRDATHPNDSDGKGGFSFTKLDAEGNELSASAADWACVRDNVTGLVWDARSEEEGLHYKNNRYSWYDPNPATNGGDEGLDEPGGFRQQCTGSECNTQTLMNALNAKRYCGHNLWRLPTAMEVVSLVDLSINSIDPTYFRLDDESSRVWTSQTVPSERDEAYEITVQPSIAPVGYIGDASKSNAEAVLPVSD